MHPYEAAVLGRYARNLFAFPAKKRKRYRGSPLSSQSALYWLFTHRADLDVPMALFHTALAPVFKGQTAQGHKVGKILADFSLADEVFGDDAQDIEFPEGPALKAIRAWARTSPPTPGTRLSTMARRIETLVGALGLTPVETDVLGLLMRLNGDLGFEALIKGVFEGDWFVDQPCGHRRDITWDQVGIILGLSSGQLERVKSSQSALRKLGLFSTCQQDAEISDPVVQISRSEGVVSKASIIQTLMGRKCRTSGTMTKWDDFTHLGAVRDVAARLLAGALREQENGIVILLHGPPGTGKTAFAQTLIRQIKATGWMIGEMDDDGGESTRHERLSSLLLASALSRHSSDSVLVLDEADDVFHIGGGFAGNGLGQQMRGGNGSKIFMNKALAACRITYF